MPPGDVHARLTLWMRECLRPPNATVDVGPDAGRNPYPRERGDSVAWRPAAVLLPLVIRPEGVQLLLTQRAPGLSAHPGQISLPGGRIEPVDGDAVAAALRETEEEIGIPRQAVHVLGLLDPLSSHTGYRIQPVVGVVDTPRALRLHAPEVAEAFEVPLGHLIDSGNHRQEERTLDGVRRRYHVIEYRTRNIWGITASILVAFSTRARTSPRHREFMT